MKEIKIGLLGFGNIGTGFVRLLHANRDLITKRLGAKLVLKWIADIDWKKVRATSTIEARITQDAWEVIKDPEVDIIVELIGGLEPAKSFVLASLKEGKAVVTANKALIATYGDEIFHSAEQRAANIAYEAAVGGTIPIVKTLKESFVANNFPFIMAIVNGTSNFILSKMTDENKSFAQVLKEAQELGFAEADPTYDVEGIDAAHKLAILLFLAYDIKVDLQSIYREGISGIDPVDIDFARELGYRIKLLAIARKEDTAIEARIHPTMVRKDHLLANVNSNFNAFHLYGDAAESVFLYGQGSGMMPTASAVMGDVIDLCRDLLCGISGRVPSRASAEGTLKIGSLKPMEEVVTNYYFRFSAIDKPGVLSKISGILGENDISLATVIQKGRTVGEPVPLVMISHRAREANVRKALARIDELDVVVGKTVFIRMEDEIL
jgi:homoserine dehydrogenase